MTFISAAFVDVYYGVMHYMPAPACNIDFLGFTLQQVFRQFEVWSSRPGLINPIVSCGVKGGARLLLRGLATLQTLVTYALLTLFLLALRKRFRML